MIVDIPIFLVVMILLKVVDLFLDVLPLVLRQIHRQKPLVTLARLFLLTLHLVGLSSDHDAGEGIVVEGE